MQQKDTKQRKPTTHRKPAEEQQSIKQQQPIQQKQTAEKPEPEPAEQRESPKLPKPAKKSQKRKFLLDFVEEEAPPIHFELEESFEDIDEASTSEKSKHSEVKGKKSRLNVVIGKKAAQRRTVKKKTVVDYEEENILDYDSNDTDVEDPQPPVDKKNSFGWKKARWNIDPRKERNLTSFLPTLKMSQLQPLNEIDFFFRMLPVRYI